MTFSHQNDELSLTCSNRREKEPRDAVLSSTKDSVQAQVAGELARALKADLEIKHR